VALLISAAALGSSWAGYEAARWSGKQATLGNEAISLRTRSTRASTLAGQLRAIDVALFTSWLAAYANGDTTLARFEERRFRSEFKPAFEKWVDSRPLLSADAASTPFALVEYRIAADSEAAWLERAADSAATASGNANQLSDGYVLDVVILATLMFFASTANQPGSPWIRRALLGMALLFFCAGAYRLITAPRA
jgi:hypothetical protein